MASNKRTTHPDDDVLMYLVDDEEAAPATAISQHVASCAQCTQRVAELRATRRLLQDVAPYAVPPQHDIAARAMRRLRIRRNAIGNMNEVFCAVRALLRGLVDLFGGGPPADTSGRVPRPDKGARHG